MAVLEVCTFRLHGDEAAFRAADVRMQTDFAYQQQGLLRRTTARGGGGEWLVLCMWADEGAAAAARAAEAGDPVAQAFWSECDAGSVDRRVFTTLE